jgi:hypothetical protein
MSEYQTHELKCWPEYFKAVQSGNKTFEVRKFDRPFAVGDTLVLREYDPKIRDYTGQEETRKISYIFDLTYLPDGERPIYGGYVVLGLSRTQPDNPAHWISVKTGYPEGLALVHIPHRDYMIAEYHPSNGEWWNDEQGQITGVTHWMPLPEPPKDAYRKDGDEK